MIRIRRPLTPSFIFEGHHCTLQLQAYVSLQYIIKSSFQVNGKSQLYNETAFPDVQMFRLKSMPSQWIY
jgi:hypothetical protein